MRWRTFPVLLTIAAAGVLAACGDDDDPMVSLEPCNADVVGVYEPAVLTFDVRGNLPEKDVLDRIDKGIMPRLVIDKVGGFQLAFLDPASGKFTTLEGVCEDISGGVTIAFDDGSDAEILLLPQKLDLSHGDASLSFSGPVSVRRARLIELVPEFEDEPLTNPVPGDLQVVFARVD